MSKVILITGASSGFGKATAEKLLAEGYIVYAAARRLEKMDDLQSRGAYILDMDVTDTTSVEKGVRQVIEEQRRIDVVFNNAGFGSYGTIESLPLEEIQYQYEVNVFGIARVLKVVLPQMRKQKSGLVINTASMVGHISPAVMGWYASTKYAVEALSDSLRQEVRHLGIKVVIIEPGGVKTEFATVALENLEKVQHPAEYQKMVESFKRGIQAMDLHAPGPESTANAVLQAIKAKHPKLRYRTTSDAQWYPLIKRIIGDWLFDKLMSKW